MLEIPEDMGNAVKIRGVIIPAVNIQTKPPEGYNLYFEILFECGMLWVVWFENGKVWVDSHHDWAHTQDIQNPDNTHAFEDWDLFLQNLHFWNAPYSGAFTIDKMAA